MDFSSPPCFDEQASRPTLFDWLGGLVLPAICVAVAWWLLDFPLPGSRLPPVALFAQGFIGIELAVLLGWLAGQGRVGALAPFLSGALGVGAAFAFFVGLCMLPLTVLGTIHAYGLGLLGLVPFLTACVFARSAINCYYFAQARCGTAMLAAGLLIGAALAVAAPAASTCASSVGGRSCIGWP